MGQSYADIVGDGPMTIDWPEWELPTRAEDWAGAREAISTQTSPLPSECKDNLRLGAISALAGNHLDLAKLMFQGE